MNHPPRDPQEPNQSTSPAGSDQPPQPSPALAPGASVDTAQDKSAPSPQAMRVSIPRSAPYVTYSIIGVTVFVYILQLASQALLQTDIPVQLFAKANDLIQVGQLWRLLTPALVHGSIAHIGFNMYALLSFGTGLERYFGHGRFLLLYVLGAFSGNVLSFFFSPEPSIGASTAVFGLLGAEAVFLIQNRKLFAGQFRSAIGNIIFIAAINLFIIGALPGIDNWGHIGGLLGGLIFTLFGGPVWEIEGISPDYHLVDKRSARDVITGAAIDVLIFGGLAMWRMMR